MSLYNKKGKVSDIERPISSNIHGRDILGVNPGITAMNKSNIDIEDERTTLDFTSRIK